MREDTLYESTLNVLDQLTRFSNIDPYKFSSEDKEKLQDIVKRVTDIFAEKNMTYTEAYGALKVVARVLDHYSKKITIQRQD